jgi:hypothetical protein
VSVPLFIVHAYQASWKQLTFCECRAGKQYRKYLLKVWARIQSGEEYIPPAMLERIKDELATSAPPIPTVRQPLPLSPYDATPLPPPADDEDAYFIPSMHLATEELAEVYA